MKIYVTFLGKPSILVEKWSIKVEHFSGGIKA